MNDVNRAVNSAANAPPSKWIEYLARLGYAAKGLVYIIIGFLAIKTGMGTGGQVKDSGGALATLVDEPFGKTMLIIAGVGLMGYAFWRLIQAIKDPEHEGNSAKGLMKRAGYGISALLHGGLAVQAFRLIGGGSDKSGDASAQDWTAKLMEQPFGRYLVIVVGLAIMIWAVREFVAAYRAKFMSKLERPDVKPKTLDVIRTIGRIGYSARGLVSLIIGFFLLSAGLKSDSSRAKGLSGALESLLQQPYGPWLLALVGVGLLAYGVFQLVHAKYRIIRPAA